MIFGLSKLSNRDPSCLTDMRRLIVSSYFCCEAGFPPSFFTSLTPWSTVVVVKIFGVRERREEGEPSFPFLISWIESFGRGSTPNGELRRHLPFERNTKY